jgi:holo-[acyl-carrier protein] synthase
MILGTGVDLVSIKQTKRLLKRFGDRFLKKVFTAAEIRRGKALAMPEQEFAAWFAAKEAVMKALGAGILAGVRFREIEVVAGTVTRPEIELYGEAKKRAEKMGVKKIHLSLSHELDYAAAMAVIENAGGSR